MQQNTLHKPVILWLFIVMLMVYAMIIVGGLTRLTNSGLSMVDWRPIMGIFPPMNLEQWQAVFETYRLSPEYQQINRGMSLDEFKYIFYWEYGHRVLGRLVGVVFFIPFAFFLFTKRVKGSLAVKLGIAFILGGAQGLLGWYMVKSGLVDVPRVSQYRLAAHLSLAFFLLCYLYWICLGLMYPRKRNLDKAGFVGFSVFLLVLTSIQLLFGALTAGLDAGLMYNTFPDMNGTFLPAGSFAMQPVLINFFENPVTVQFTHRILGWALFFSVIVLFVKGLMSKVSGVRRFLHAALLLTVFFQFILGVMTLVMAVPLQWASIHQAGAGVFLLLAVTNLYSEYRYS